MPYTPKHFRNTGTINQRTVKQVFEATRFVQQQPRNEVIPPAAPVDGTGGLMLKVTTALNPMSGANPGVNGRGKIQKFDGTSYSDWSTTPYPIINNTDATVAVGSYVPCISMYGYWHYVLVDKCSNLTGGS